MPDGEGKYGIGPFCGMRPDEQATCLEGHLQLPIVIVAVAERREQELSPKVFQTLVFMFMAVVPVIPLIVIYLHPPLIDHCQLPSKIGIQQGLRDIQHAWD